MPANEFVKSVLPSANRNDFGAFKNKAVGHGSTYAGCRTDQENTSVLERHFEINCLVLECIEIEEVVEFDFRDWIIMVTLFRENRLLYTIQGQAISMKYHVRIQSMLTIRRL